MNVKEHEHEHLKEPIFSI